MEIYKCFRNPAKKPLSSLLLKKTIIYPNEDPNRILNRPCLKIIVVVDDENLVETADVLAQNPSSEIDRQVIWYKNLNGIDLNTKFPGLPADLSRIQAFSLSKINKVCDVIRNWKPRDYVLMESIFEHAELEENN